MDVRTVGKPYAFTDKQSYVHLENDSESKALIKYTFALGPSGFYIYTHKLNTSLTTSSVEYEK